MSQNLLFFRVAPARGADSNQVLGGEHCDNQSEISNQIYIFEFYALASFNAVGLNFAMSG
jgi:hypothetical protein